MSIYLYIFYDRTNIINFIQYLGRSLRLYPMKIKSKIIILADKHMKDNILNNYLSAFQYND